MPGGGNKADPCRGAGRCTGAADSLRPPRSIDGLGLATRLQDLGLPDEGVLGKVVAFNVGLEIGH